VPITQDHIGPDTRLGANLVAGGATFRVWAPRALEVHLKVNANSPPWQPTPDTLLTAGAGGIWGGFVPGVKDGDAYRFFVVGNKNSGFKRDPYAREMGKGFPDCDCIVRDPGGYPWHDQGFQAPAFSDLIVYQFHIGTFYGVDDQGRDVRVNGIATFLDVLDKVEYLAALGVTAIEPLPVVEHPWDYSRGYNGTDLFSPEVVYVCDPAHLDRHLATANRLLAQKGQPPLSPADLAKPVSQLKALVDICHVWGMAVLFDVVYNHAGGDFDDQCLFNFDRAVIGDKGDGLYFTDADIGPGGRPFDYRKPEKNQVRQFLIDNARSFYDEYHGDGFRFDEVSLIDQQHGWDFCQDLSSTLRYHKPNGPQIAEFWSADQSYAFRSPADGGAGFDIVWHAGLRYAVRGAIAQAAHGRDADVNLDGVRDALYPPFGPDAAWRAVRYLENHDLVHVSNNEEPRIALQADPSDAHSWYAHSRARVANGLLLTAPGIPMLFMGQEFLERKQWTDNPPAQPGHLIGWDDLAGNKDMQDHLLFIRELVWLRRRQPALRGGQTNVYHCPPGNRVIACQRWLQGRGRDVVVVATLSEATYYNYALGFPGPGLWLEVFNSDVYENWVNPQRTGNGGAITADGPPLHGLPCSASIVIPANSILVFARDHGD
jgi:1,4-alpha-glucan branching enzyme